MTWLLFHGNSGISGQQEIRKTIFSLTYLVLSCYKKDTRHVPISTPKELSDSVFLLFEFFFVLRKDRFSMKYVYMGTTAILFLLKRVKDFSLRWPILVVWTLDPRMLY